LFDPGGQQGSLRSIATLLGVSLGIPEHTTFSLRSIDLLPLLNSPQQLAQYHFRCRAFFSVLTVLSGSTLNIRECHGWPAQPSGAFFGLA
jgi:hypothetical protein